ncbi:cell cycle checkpoint protein RAD17 isoform X2 [Ischnura elegans]|uniref:cell cycle checkpoint protein RAD17 isoform X2 n=1 Tax=Ischnura elegans TaxID=197161 RepID=UPI001ED868F0|nr:cell cycle checkpoint protein RAD17 isoform X2 [Ischnura elegans]
MSWVKPTFESEDGGIPGPILERIASSRMREGVTSKPKLVKEKAWVDSYEPTSKDHLAVHIKKVHEVETWLTAAVHGRKGTGPVGVLVGPSGCGKTATLQVLAKSMECRVKEWINPSNYKTGGAGTSSQEFVGSTNQVEQFEDFLFRASRYEDLFGSTSKGSLLLVEDIPNIYLLDSSLLEKTIRKYVEVGRCPLVFILASGTNQNVEKLFRKLQVEHQIKIISFNPVNKTLMFKALERILKAARTDQSISDMELMNIDDAVDVANGDIRFAVNHLQYMLLGERAPVICCVPPEKVLAKNVGKGGPNCEPGKSMKDRAADIFRCLGALLYNKQTTVTDKETGAVTQKPTHDPEEISSKMSSVPNLFHGLLFENYPGVISDVNSIASASDVLSQTDVMLNKHTEGEMNKKYSINVSIHGLMNLPPSVVARKFLPFKGARITEVKISARSRRTTLDYMFVEDEPNEIFQEIFIVDVPTEEKVNNSSEDESIEIEESLSSEESDGSEFDDL